MINSKLTKHFSLAEVCETNTGLPNTPTQEQLVNILALLNNVLEPIREHFGVAVNTNNIFRSEVVNNKVGGVKTSHHMCKNGYAAADIKTVGKVRLSEVYKWIKENLDYAELIWEFGTDKDPSWIHVSYNVNPKLNVKELIRTGKKK